MAAVSVVIADDHAATRAGVRRVLESSGITVLAEAGDADTAVRAAREHEPNVCILDVHMPGSGIEAAKVITRELPRTTVIMLTVSEDDQDLFAALRAGASGYLLKDMNPDRLADALHGMLAGETAMPRTLMSRVVEELRGSGRRRISTPDGRTVQLSEREWQILESLAAGRSTAQIAEDLHVSPVTVRRHVSTLLGKLRVSDRASAVALLRHRSGS